MVLYPGMISITLSYRKQTVKLTAAGYLPMPTIHPRIARVDLTTFKTAEILELPNSAGNHSSPFITENTEYVVAGTRFVFPWIMTMEMFLSILTERILRLPLSFISVDKEYRQYENCLSVKSAPGRF